MIEREERKEKIKIKRIQNQVKIGCKIINIQ